MNIGLKRLIVGIRLFGVASLVTSVGFGLNAMYLFFYGDSTAYERLTHAALLLCATLVAVAVENLMKKCGTR